MIPYKNLSGSSGIAAYEFRDDAIIVRFVDGSEYLYDNLNCGVEQILRMKKLAMKGAGLTTFINKKTRNCYSRKIK